MENNLYYTPTIEELSINQEVYLLDTGNYKAEYTKGDIYPMLSVITQLTDYPIIWVRNSYNGKGFKTYEVYPNQIGLKYLDHSDIESLGWNFIIDKSIIYNYELRSYILSHNTFKNIIDISLKGLFETQGPSRIFRGIIKNKSELIKLMQQLNIK